MSTIGVMEEIQRAFQTGKRVKVHIQFGTLQGHFFVERIEPTEHAEDWIFQGGDFRLMTGRYVFHAKSETPSSIEYIFSSKLTIHPQKSIIFEIIG